MAVTKGTSLHVTATDITEMEAKIKSLLTDPTLTAMATSMPTPPPRTGARVERLEDRVDTIAGYINTLLNKIDTLEEEMLELQRQPTRTKKQNRRKK
jgi:hypothetical protein